MAIVKLSPTLKSQILNNVDKIKSETFGPLPEYPNGVPFEVANEAYNILLPEEFEKKALELIPPWGVKLTNTFYLGITHPKTEEHRARYDVVGLTRVRMAHNRMQMFGRTTIRSTPGLSYATWDGECLILCPSDDGTEVDAPNLRSFIAKAKEVSAKHKQYREEMAEARSTMSKFLDQHTTLQKAVKAFGPALMTYVPKHAIDMYNKPAGPRKKKDKPAVEAVDVTSLIVAATESRLQLNA